MEATRVARDLVLGKEEKGLERRSGTVPFVNDLSVSLGLSTKPLGTVDRHKASF